MTKAEPFERHTDRYDAWFEAYADVYRSEVAALRRLTPETGDGIEIGVGTGRFAAPLGIEVGVDPATEMLVTARDRGIEPVEGIAESLPFADGSFDVALIVTTVCFVDDVPRTLAEAHRVLRPGGSLVIGYIDEDTPVGRKYEELKENNPFYREATFVSTEQLVAELERVGFGEFEFVQTVYQWIDDVDGLEPINSGYGDGSFVGISGTK